MAQLLSVQKIWDRAPHNAFTDLIHFKGSFFCAFREGEQHAGGEDGTVRILQSVDGLTWKSAVTLSKKGIDLRDPKFSIMPDGRLMLSLGGSRFNGEEYLGRSPHVAFSTDGIYWSDIQDVHMPHEWIWHVTWHKEVGYGVSYRYSDQQDNEQPWISTLFQTQNGLHYSKITEFAIPDYPSEVTLRFQPDGTMIALARRYGGAWVGHAKPPYHDWQWAETEYRLGGPDFLILPNGDMWAAARVVTGQGEEAKTETVLGKMTLTSFTPVLVFPSGGDTSYPGMVYYNGILFVSYYSSHEGKSAIYLARVQLGS